jgi:hypothetical protein
MRFRSAAASAVVIALAALLSAARAHAAAEVHRCSLVLTAMPAQVVGGDFNDAIDQYNKVALTPYGLEEMKHISFTWIYDTELRYFVRPNFAVAAGLSQIKATQTKEFLPQIAQSLDITAQVITVPVHVGAAYYLQPYNQGDFQARAFIGGGLMQYTYTRATFSQNFVGPDTTGAMTFKYGLTQDAPGYYLEGGGHMFFASRWSVLISLLYRSGKLRNMQYDELIALGQRVNVPPGVTAYNTHGKPFTLDVGGVGVRFAAAWGF